MAKIVIHIPQEFLDEVSDSQVQHLKKFMQGMVHRLVQGHYRYGNPKRDKKYWDRLKKELKAYRDGNQERLINAANYCWLETFAPQNPKAHHNAAVESATRIEK